MDESIRRRVRERAGRRCEYCQLPEILHPALFQVDHIIAQQHGGETILDNLALSCARCNKRKGPNLSGIDPETTALIRLYNPRQDHWEDHFEWEGPMLIGRTALGRATIAVLGINQLGRVAQREALIASEEFPQ